MGAFEVDCELQELTGRQPPVRIAGVMVDTGSEYTWLPEELLARAGIGVRKKDLAFVMANGTRITRDVGYAYLRSSGFETVDEVVFAHPGDLRLLGARTIEGFAALVDARRKRLVASGPLPVATGFNEGGSITPLGVETKSHANERVPVVLPQLRFGPVEREHLPAHDHPASAAPLHEAHAGHEVRQRFVSRPGVGAGADALLRHVVGQRTGAGHVDVPVEHLEQHLRARDGVIAVRHRVRQRLSNGSAGQQVAIAAHEALVGLETAETEKPPGGPLDLLVETTGRIGNLQHLGGTIIACVGHALDAEVARPRVALLVSSEGQHAVERRPQRAADLDQHIPVAQVVLGVRLRIVRGVEAEASQVRTERVQVDVRGRCVQNRPLFGQDVAEGVVELLELGGRRLDIAPLAPDPDPPVVPQRLESALARDVDPMHPARRLLAAPGARVNRLTATRLQKRGQALLHPLGILPDAGDSP